MAKESRYKGHRVLVVVPFDLYEELKNDADSECRPVANKLLSILAEYYGKAKAVKPRTKNTEA